MAKNRVTYNVEGLFAGPAPATGFNFLSATSGDFHNNPLASDSYNLITPIHRVIGVSYDIQMERAEIRALGAHSLISRPIITSPVVNLSFDYYQVGVNNEYRMGLYTNYSTNLNSTPFYANNSGVYILSGFSTKSFTRARNNLGWPLDYRDNRNFFVAISKTEDDLSTRNERTRRDVNVIGIGNCYMTSYSTVAEVGQPAKCSVSYIGENIKIDSSGSGFFSPAVHFRDGTPVSGVRCVIPPIYNSGVDSIAPAAITPGNISVNILSYIDTTNRYASNGLTTSTAQLTKTNDIKHIGVDFRDLKIERYTVSLELRRQALNALNFRHPADRKLLFPVYANIDFDVLVGDSSTGSLVNLVSEDADYEISLRLSHPNPNSGQLVRYDFRGAKFQGVSYQTSIGQNKTARLSFVTELNPKDLTRGMFMSGVFFMTPSSSSFLLKEDLSYLLLEDGGRIVLGTEQTKPVI